MNVSEVIATVAADEAPIAFGVMGNGNAHVIGALTARGFRFVATRHEDGAVSAAQGYAVASGEVPLVTTTFGPGFTNTLTMLADAHKSGTPLVLVTGAGPSRARPVDVDQSALAATLGITTITVTPVTAAADMRRAFAHARAGHVPVVVAIPYDIAEAALEEGTGIVEEEPPGGAAAAEAVAAEGPARYPAVLAQDPAAPTPNPEALAHAADVLARAERPLILHGRGALAAGAAAAITRLADGLGALIGTSLHTRGMTGSPWELGVVGGFSSPAAADLIQRADAVLVLGASLNEFQTRYGQYFAGARHVIQVDVAAEPTSTTVTTFLHGDARLVADALADAIPQRDGRTWRDAVPGVADHSIHRPAALRETCDDGLLNPRAVAIALDEMLPANRAFVQDGGHFFGWLNMYAAVPEPAAMQHPGTGFHTIGTGVPAALGVALARPDLLAVAVTGDGGAMMCLPELETLIREAPRALVVSFNDSAYGMEVHQYVPRGVDSAAMLFPDVDFAAIVTAMGGRGHTVRALPDLAVLREWLANDGDGVLVLDVKVSRSEVAEFVSEKVALEAEQTGGRAQVAELSGG